MERRTADVGGIANPAANPQATSTATGAPSSPQRPARPGALAWMTASGTSTARWPKRSTKRPCTGAPRPLPAASAPATPPAIANEPVLARRYSTIARALIPIGKRAASVAATSAAKYGTWRRS